VDYFEWALSGHLLPIFANYRLSEIGPELVDRYKVAKLREREEKLVERPLANSSLNKTLKIGAQVFDAAIEYGLVTANPFRGKRRRVRESKPHRTWLELREVGAILDAAGKRRALLATMILAGLRVGELMALRC
jgi:integrase